MQLQLRYALILIMLTHTLLQDERVAVCSIEKANVALNKMLSEGRLGELVAVVVDEVHMVTDPHRCVMVVCDIWFMHVIVVQTSHTGRPAAVASVRSPLDSSSDQIASSSSDPLLIHLASSSDQIPS